MILNILEKKNKYHGLQLSSYLFILIPFLLITGPFLPDLSLVIIITLFTYSLIKSGKLIYFKNIYVYFFLTFFLCIIISLINSEYAYIAYKPSLSYFRFGLFALATASILYFKNDIIVKLSKFFILILIVLGIDTFFQYIFGFNILGWQRLDNNFRITSLFGEDEVLGSYIARFFPFILSLFLFSKKYYNKKYENFIIFLIILLSGIICLFSGERTSFFLFLISIFLILFTCHSIRKVFFRSTLILIPVLLTLLFTDQKIKFRMYDFTIKQLGFNSESKRIVIFSEIYEGHYKIAYKMFREKPLTGHGVKSFREYCSKEENFVAVNACTTHPHNIYMQLLAETGIISFLLVISIFILISIKLINISFNSLIKKNNKTEDYLTLIYIFYAVNLFPIAPSGNFFNNWMSIIYYLPSGYFIYLNNFKNARI